MWRQELATALKKNWTIWLVLFFLLIFSGFFGLREFWRWYNLKSEYNKLNQDIVTTENQINELNQEKENMNNPVFLEKEARTKLNLKKEGELVLTVISDDKSFPKEDFLSQMVQGKFDQKPGFWFNLKNWQEYFFK